MPPSGTASKPIKLRLSELYRGVTEKIREKETACQSLTARLHQTTQHNNELPGQISNREATIRTMKETFMAGSAQALDCELWDSQRTATSEAARGNIAASLEDKVQTLRRRKDLRVWACNELRAAINESMTRASELKKAISVLVTEVKKEELAHKVKAKRLDGIIASVSESKNPSATAGTASTSYPAAKMVPEKMVAQGLEKKARLLEAIEQRKTYLRARTEQVFDARNDVRVLEQKKADVTAEITALEREIAHVQRSCTPRPDWGQLINAALVTTAIDRAGKKAKVKIESSRKKLLGQKGKHDESGDHEEPEETRNKKLKHILTSNWSTVEKVNLMSAELTRIRTKYHAGDILLLEQAKLDHLQKEIDKTLQQLEAIKAKSSE
uniref:Uncharacterized protein n=1 Tax=Globisporangium ultimum (strain ATCC 200006 / CBS 805.95 / DAOM BR144) TaxID=431595 RepID=K3WLL2_GLOUD